MIVVLLSGPVAVGKSTAAAALAADASVARISTSAVLRRRLRRGATATRDDLEGAGAAALATSGGSWIVEEVNAVASGLDLDAIVVDSVRRLEEVEAIRDLFSEVCHAHLIATQEELADRFNRRRRDIDTAAFEYRDVVAHPTERLVSALAGVANLVIDTSLTDPENVAAQVRRAARLPPST